MAKRRRTACYTTGSHKHRVAQAITVRPECHVEDVMKATRLTKKQVANALTQLRKARYFPDGSKWYGRKGTPKKNGISVTQDEILTIAGIGVVKTREILRLLTKLQGC